MFWIAVQIVTILFVESSSSQHEETNRTECISEPSCMRCGPKGCIKCPTLIVFPSRRCVTTCPYGHQSKWSTLHDYMGEMCVHNGNFLGLHAQTATILTGILAGLILCLLFLTIAVIYIRFKRLKTANLPPSIETSSDMDPDSPERRDFLKQLETLRPYAETYLEMLNDTRRQLRELHRNGDGGALAAYKPVVRDLAKILLLLNRKTDRINVPPDDWEHLFSWAEKALKRYKRMSDVSQPQVAQLINFLQGPIVSDLDVRSGGSTIMSTFKPDQVFGSSLSLSGSSGIRNLSSNYEQSTLNPQWKFEYSLVNNQAQQHPVVSSEFNPVLWKNSKEYLNSSLFLDDDFCQLGFRPQDEITTEL